MSTNADSEKMREEALNRWVIKMAREVEVNFMMKCSYRDGFEDARKLIAANVAIGEREAFLTWWCADVPEYMREKWKESVDECLRNNHAQDKLVGAWDGFQFGLTVARAALTAEKVAGPVAVYPQGVMGIPPYSPPGSGSVTVEPGISRNAAPQQPAQPVAQTLALTDEQRGAISRAADWCYAMAYEADEKALRALLAAQPESSLAEGGERE